jgi:hypothetical protein
MVRPGADYSNLKPMFWIPPGVAIHDVDPVTTGEVVQRPLTVYFE